MKLCTLIVVLGYATSICGKTNRKLFEPKLAKECEKMVEHCSAGLAPRCVRLNHKVAKRHIHIYVVDDCEMHYMKCHKDYEVMEVPMKHCGINFYSYHIDKLTNINDSAKYPRKAFSLVTAAMKFSNIRSKSHDKPTTVAPNNVHNRVKRSLDDPPKNLRSPAEKTPEGGRVVETVSYLNRPKKLSLPRIKNKHYWHNIRQFKFTPKDLGNQYENRNVLNEETDTEADQHANLPAQQPDSDGYVEYAIDESSEGLQPDKFEEEDECPHVCPARDVMVCAKCQDGIYKTFLSQCHMRLFVCSHENEKLELVSRLPCLLSAPYLEAAAMKPEGKLSEPDSNDRVKHFIHCRDSGKLDSPAHAVVDEKCDFSGDKEIITDDKN